MAISVFENEILTDFATKYIAAFKKAIETKQISRVGSQGSFSSVANSSGDLANSGEALIINNQLIITANSYLRYIILGRKNQSQQKSRPPISEIQKWINERGLDLNPWAVANSINKKGSSIFQKWQGQPSNVLEDIPLDELLDELTNNLGDRLINEITTEFINDFDLEQLNIEL